MNTSPDHPDFTALALGEHINGTPARAVLDALRTSVAARNEAEHIRSTAENLAFALKGERPLRLDAARRHAIFNAEPAALRARFAAEDAAASNDEPELPPVRAPRRWVHPGIAAAAVVAAAIFVTRLLPGLNTPSKNDLSPVVDTKSGGEMMINPPQATTGREKARGLPPPSVAGSDSVPVPPAKSSDLPGSDSPSVVVEQSPAPVPKLPEADAIVPPLPGNPPPHKDPRNFDYATPIKKR